MEIKNQVPGNSESQSLFLKQLLEKLPVGIQIFDNSGLTEYINQKQAALLGIEDVLIAIGKFNVLTDSYSIANGSAEFYQQVYTNKTTASRNFKADFGLKENTWNTTKTKRYFHECAIPVLDDKGNVSKVVAVLNDYTDDKQSNKILFESEQRFRSIFENSVSGIAFTDTDGKFLLVNKPFQKFIGFNSEELIKLKFSDITYKEDIKKGEDLIRCAIEEKTDNCRLEKRYVRKNGELVWGDISIGVIRNSNDSPINFVAIIKEITHKKQAEDELSKALQFNQSIINTSPVGIVSTDENGQILFANKKAESLLGLSKKDIKQLAYNAPNWKITGIDGGIYPESELPFIIVKETKQAVNNIQHAIEWPNGKRISLSINARAQLDNKDNFLGMVATLEDITEQLEIQNQIKSNNTFLNAIITNAAEGLCVCHNCIDYPFVKFTIWNDKMIKMTGYTMGEINKLGWYQTLYQDPEIREKAMKRMENMRMGDDISSEEWLITRKDKQKRTVSISTSIIAINNDEVNVMALMNDITEKQNAKIAIEEANRKLKKINDSKDRFFEILAHDLKGPLGASVSLSQSLYENMEEEGETLDTKMYIGHILESVQRSFKLLEDLLDWSKAQTHKTEFNPKKINFNKLVEQAIELLKDVALNKSVNVEFNSNIDLEIVADKNMILTILRNLINNAIKYSFAGGKIIIQATDDTNLTHISVIDRGVGINKERLVNLFKIDKNVSTRGTDNEKGTGLGLLLCKELVNYHGGEIWASSIPGKGTEFTFTIPSKDHK